MRTGRRVALSVVLAVAILAAGGLSGVVAEDSERDSGFVIDRFDRVVEVRNDGTARVWETLEVTFLERRRGIFRDLPTTGPVAAAYEIRGVDQGDGTPWTWLREDLTGDGIVRVRIGDAAVWLEPGTYTYRLLYDMTGLAFAFPQAPSGAEVRIDVPGFDWPTDIGATTLTVRVPGEVRGLECVAGRLRTVSPCDPAPEVAGDTATATFGPFAPRRAATVAIGVDPDAFAVTLPASTTAKPLLSRPGVVPRVDLPPWQSGLLLTVVFLLPFVPLEVAKSVLVYRDEETDSQLHDRMHPTATFAPPHGHRPVEVAGLLLNIFQPRSLLMATLIDLDQRGVVHASLDETAPPPARGRRARRRKKADEAGTLVVRPGPPGSSPPTASDRALLDALLPGGQPVVFDGEYDSDTAHRTNQASALLQRQARRVFRDSGYEHDRAPWLRHPVMRALIVAVMVLLLWAGSSIGARVLGLPTGGETAIAVVVLVGWMLFRVVWAHHRLPLNSRGRDAAAQARSFREFLATVQQDQLEWAAGQPGIDHHHPAVSLLPYAVALGLADSWYERFGPLLAELTAGAAVAGGTTWWASSSGFKTAQTTSASSSSSGGSGGGSGGGGGGGGSW